VWKVLTILDWYKFYALFNYHVYFIVYCFFIKKKAISTIKYVWNLATWVIISTLVSIIIFGYLLTLSSRLARLCTCKRVIQASAASSHLVGKCNVEPSKQLRIRRSSFWSHRRSTVLWETALSSKERSRRVNCPMLALFVCLFFLIKMEW